MRKTKVVCTIGPACETEEILTKMCLEGMNVARLNFSHGTHAVNEAKKTLELAKGDNVVLTGGQPNGQSGNTNIIKVEKISR